MAPSDRGVIHPPERMSDGHEGDAHANYGRQHDQTDGGTFRGERNCQHVTAEIGALHHRLPRERGGLEGSQEMASH